MQPGSSCITSFTESETTPKKIALLEIKGRDFKVNPIVSPNMRRFVFRSIRLCSYGQLDASSPTITTDMERVLDEEMEGILREIEEGNPNTTETPAKLPLVRLVVDVTGFPSIPIQIYGAKFVGRIANPSSLLCLKRKRVGSGTHGTEGEEETAGDGLSGMAQFDMMASMVDKSLEEMGGLTILNNRHMREACMRVAIGSVRSVAVREQRVLAVVERDAPSFRPVGGVHVPVAGRHRRRSGEHHQSDKGGGVW